MGPVASWVPSTLRAQDSGPLLLQLRSLQTQLCPGVQASSVEAPPPPAPSWAAWRFSDYTVARAPTLVGAAPFARRPVPSARLWGWPLPSLCLDSTSACCDLSRAPRLPDLPTLIQKAACSPPPALRAAPGSLGGDFPVPVSPGAPQPEWLMRPGCAGPWGQSPVCTRLGSLCSLAGGELHDGRCRSVETLSSEGLR